MLYLFTALSGVSPPLLLIHLSGLGLEASAHHNQRTTNKTKPKLAKWISPCELLNLQSFSSV